MAVFRTMLPVVMASLLGFDPMLGEKFPDILKDPSALIFRVKRSKKIANERFYGNIILSHGVCLFSQTCNTWLSTCFTFHSLVAKSPSQAETIFCTWGCDWGGTVWLRAGVGSEMSKKVCQTSDTTCDLKFFTPDQFITFGNLLECVPYWICKKINQYLQPFIPEQ
jgi:hypothetical protein